MTTDAELRSILHGEAEGPTGDPAPWDAVRARGRHHRRAARARVTGGVAALAALAIGLGSALVDRDEATTVVVDQPDGMATTSTTATIGSGTSYPIGADARVSGVFVTITIEPADPADPGTEVLPCGERRPVVAETTDAVTIAVRDRYDPAGNSDWAACQSSPFSGWATVELTDPLGRRRLLDESGREIPVLDNADLLFPTVLPAPFDLTRWDEFGGETGLVDRTFSWSAADLVLNVRNAPLEGTVPLGANPGDGCTDGQATTVRGHDALLCIAEEGGGFIVLWDEGGYRRQIELAPLSDNTSPFTLEDLLAIANGLEPLG